MIVERYGIAVAFRNLIVREPAFIHPNFAPNSTGPYSTFVSYQLTLLNSVVFLKPICQPLTLPDPADYCKHIVNLHH